MTKRARPEEEEEVVVTETSSECPWTNLLVEDLRQRIRQDLDPLTALCLALTSKDNWTHWTPPPPARPASHDLSSTVPTAYWVGAYATATFFNKRIDTC